MRRMYEAATRALSMKMLPNKHKNSFHLLLVCFIDDASHFTSKLHRMRSNSTQTDVHTCYIRRLQIHTSNAIVSCVVSCDVHKSIRSQSESPVIRGWPDVIHQEITCFKYTQIFAHFVLESGLRWIQLDWKPFVSYVVWEKEPWPETKTSPKSQYKKLGIGFFYLSL